MGICRVSGPQQLSMDARSSDAPVVEMKAFGEGRLKSSRDKLDSWIQVPYFRQTSFPEFVEVGRAGIGTRIGFELPTGHVEG